MRLKSDQLELGFSLCFFLELCGSVLTLYALMDSYPIVLTEGSHLKISKILYFFLCINVFILGNNEEPD